MISRLQWYLLYYAYIKTYSILRSRCWPKQRIIFYSGINYMLLKYKEPTTRSLYIRVSMSMAY